MHFDGGKLLNGHTKGKPWAVELNVNDSEKKNSSIPGFHLPNSPGQNTRILP